MFASRRVNPGSSNRLIVKIAEGSHQGGFKWFLQFSTGGMATESGAYVRDEKVMQETHFSVVFPWPQGGRIVPVVPDRRSLQGQVSLRSTRMSSASWLYSGLDSKKSAQEKTDFVVWGLILFRSVFMVPLEEEWGAKIQKSCRNRWLVLDSPMSKRGGKNRFSNELRG